MRRPALLVLVTLVAACGLGTAPDAERLALDPLTLVRTGKPNDYLVCPQARCAAGTDQASPILPIAAADQLRLWEEVIRFSPRTRILRLDEAALTLHAEQRSRLLRFTDTIAIRVITIDATHSTFAAYSRAELGHSDLGVNRIRLQTWITDLQATAGG